MLPAIASRIPLVKRPKAPALPLDQRITHLTELTVAPAGASHHDLVARACGVLNYAALIASDVGMPDLATDLCWRQHRIFAEARHLTSGTAVMSLMPLVNIARLLTRAGDGHAAYDLLTRLYRAARDRGTTEIHGTTIDLSTLIGTKEDHRKICQELWVALLVDGARALARTGRWTQAAEAMTAHRGIGHRLLDGRQILIMSLMERGLDEQARATLDTTTAAEPWENAIAALLRIHCRTPDSPSPQPETDLALREASAVVARPDPATATFQVRVGLAALDLAPDRATPHAVRLQNAVADAAILDAYAARDVLDHVEAPLLTPGQKQKLDAVLTAAALGTRVLPTGFQQAVDEAADTAEGALRGLVKAH